MLRVGLTGSIATGKSTVLAECAALGLPTYSADRAVHELYEKDAVAAMETMFPGATVNGKVDRAALSAILAADPQRIVDLEELIHPLVRGKAADFFEAAEESGADIAVVEIPLLFETGSRYVLDTVIVTVCRPELQRRRALARPGMTQQKFDMVLARQMSQEEKAARADYVIDTSGSIADSASQLRQVIATLREKRGRENAGE
ncbi:dephospho-CoA kinase [Pelagibacterium xiamenense]|uniref:dephospho-CoA kinase n=1 Tax=Pelagibacterium xiamenense TaxID=2901140 RepID=UPI001E4FB9AD|nr:dephospho-CoA kinase [Pelagibacterium xiamenense]MCD7058430.1 dephospho-CoA kinase [Pelagibacterium xiamenense]